jgi:hypothetical protein
VLQSGAKVQYILGWPVPEPAFNEELTDKVDGHL